MASEREALERIVEARRRKQQTSGQLRHLKRVLGDGHPNILAMKRIYSEDRLEYKMAWRMALEVLDEPHGCEEAWLNEQY